MQRDVSENDRIRGIKLPKEISKDLAYLCGIFAGDGSLGYRRKKNEYCLKVVGNPKDEKEFYHQVIGPKFEKVFGILPRMKYHDSKTTYGFSIYSKSIYLYLVNVTGLPSGVKYHSLKVPDIFLDDKKLTMAFIRGVFDTDGCISFKKRYRTEPYYPTISVCSKSRKFIDEIADILKTTQLIFSGPYTYMQKDMRITQGHTTTSRIYIYGHKNLQIWIDTIDFYSPKHLAKIQKYAKL